MQHWGENGNDGRDGHAKRHKTRLGLAMLVRLAQGHERYVLVRGSYRNKRQGFAEYIHLRKDQSLSMFAKKNTKDNFT